MSKASDLLEIIEWGLETHKEKLMFGLPDLQAAIARETRLNSILVDCKEGIQSLEAENAKLKAELVKERDIVNRLEAGETSYFVLEKQARQRQKERDQPILKDSNETNESN